MEVKAKLLDQANALVEAKIDSGELNKKVENLAKNTAKNIKMDGFRKGKVPVSAVMKRYGKDLQNDARNDALREVIGKSLDTLNKKPDTLIGDPIVSKFNENDGFIDVEVKISFKPAVVVDGYESIIPEYATPRVTKKEIEEKVNEFLKMVAPIQKIEKNVLESGDFAKFDFEGFVDGAAFDGGKAENYILEIGSGQFIPGFEDGMIGLKVGETKDIKVKFPDNYSAPNLAGKEAVFKVKLHEIQAKQIGTLDDETLKKLMPGEAKPTAEKFEDRIKAQIRAFKLQKLINEDLKPKFADKAVTEFEFDLPSNIVEQEMDMQLRNAWETFSNDEKQKMLADRAELDKKRESFRQDAQKSVKLTFIIDELAKVRNISVSDQELVEAIYLEAYRYGADPKSHFESYKNRGILPAVKMAMIEEKLFNDLFGKKDTKEDNA